MKDKNFDCVEMMHKGGAAIRKRLQGMTEKEELEYWNERNKELRNRQKALPKSQNAPRKK